MPDSQPAFANRAVFVSYAREDTASAQRIAEALRSQGVEVWFDQNELRGGDAWDQKIRRQINDCTLFLPVISQHTQDRSKGYFRLEWKLAVEQTHLMAEGVPFLAPIVVDDTRESGAIVPAEFMKVQWTRLPGALPTPSFIDQIKRLLEASQKTVEAKKDAPAAPVVAKSGFPIGIVAALVAAVLGLVAFIALRPTALKETPSVAAAVPVTPVTSNKPTLPAPAVIGDKSIAVLPFVDMSQAKDQEYFSDGLSEELLNLLAKVPALQVTSRSSAFSYKGKDLKLAQVARELGVAHILEGSVRKSGNRLRITAQLIDARTDKHLWSETYDRSLEDIFAVQDDIAGAVVAQLKVALLGAAPKAKAADPKAFALSLQARQLVREGSSESLEQAVAVYQQALAIDPNMTAGWIGLAGCYTLQASTGGRSNDEAFQLAQEAVQKALKIDPDFAPAHALLGSMARSTDEDLTASARHFEHALALEPANAEIIALSLLLLRSLGRLDQMIAFAEYLVAHDPLNAAGHSRLGGAYVLAGRFDEGIATLRTALRLTPGRAQSHYRIGMTLLQQGDAKAALAELLQEPSAGWRLEGLAMAYHALGQKAQSDAALAELMRTMEKDGAWNIAYVFAFRGEADRAFAWLDKAIVYRDPGLSDTAVMPEFAKLRSDPRWLPFLRKIHRAPEQVDAVKFDAKLPSK